MARALVIERDTTELWIVLERRYRLPMAESMTLTITRVVLPWLEPLPPCDDSCRPVRQLISVMDCPPSKVYSANRIESGRAVFLLDKDMTEAPEGWYRAMIEVNRCELAVLPLLVLDQRITVCSYRMVCI